MSDKVVLAYSGGLDTSVAIPWLKEHYGLEVITLTMELGNQADLETVKERALNSGAIKALVLDARQEFLKEYVLPALRANAVYQGQYPLATALSRPLIAWHLAKVALQEGAEAIAHGCTGKGNDQVRLDVGVGALAPQLKVIAPAREWGMTREEEVAYAQRKGIPLPGLKKSLYSVDENLWGRSIESGPLEDPWTEPPEEVYAWTRSVADAPQAPAYVEIEFEQGLPLALNGERLEPVSLVAELNRRAGEHGVGRIDHLEDRLVGIKSREIYEAPAATVLIAAHRALEGMALSKDQLRFKERVSQEYSELVYNGLWFSALRRDLAAFVESSQRYVTGSVRVRLHKGQAAVVGRKSPYSLYRYELATYDKGDAFDPKASPGFIHIWGLPTRTQAQAQGEAPRGPKRGK
ncbi:MAG: argininosuccinate synthase [Chloroflexi bacterium]|nr:argininosuccinate synthase [Chloroflexota bacterium]